MEVHISFAFGIRDKNGSDADEFFKDVYSNLCKLTHNYFNLLWADTCSDHSHPEREIKCKDYLIKYYFEYGGLISTKAKNKASKIYAIVEYKNADSDHGVAMETETSDERAVANHIDGRKEEEEERTRPKRGGRRLATKRQRTKPDKPSAHEQTTSAPDVPPPRAVSPITDPTDHVSRPMKTKQSNGADDDDIWDVYSRGVKIRTPERAKRNSWSRTESSQDLPSDSPNPDLDNNSMSLFESPVESARTESPLFWETIVPKKTLKVSEPLSKPPRSETESTDARDPLTDDLSKKKRQTSAPKTRKTRSKKVQNKDPVPEERSKSPTSEQCPLIASTSVDTNYECSPCVLPDIKHPTRSRRRVNKVSMSKEPKTDELDSDDLDYDPKSDNKTKKSAKDRKAKSVKEGTGSKTRSKKEKPKLSDEPRKGKSKKNELKSGPKVLDTWLTSTPGTSHAAQESSNADDIETGNDAMETGNWSPPNTLGNDCEGDFSPPRSSSPQLANSRYPAMDSKEDSGKKCVTTRTDNSRKKTIALSKSRKLPDFSESDEADELPTMERKARDRIRSPVKSPIFNRQSTHSIGQIEKRKVTKNLMKWQNFSNVEECTRDTEMDYEECSPVFDQDHDNDELNSSQELPDLSQRVWSDDNDATPNAQSLFATSKQKSGPRTLNTKSEFVSADTIFEKPKAPLKSSKTKGKQRRDDTIAASSIKSEPGTGYQVKSDPETGYQVKSLSETGYQIKSEPDTDYHVKNEPHDWTTEMSQSQARRQVSVVDIKRRLSSFAYNSTSDNSTLNTDDVDDDDVITSAAPNVIEISDEEMDEYDDYVSPDVLDRQIETVCDVKNLTERQLIHLVKRNKHRLADICHGKGRCERHEAYMKGGKARANLIENAHLQRYHEEQDDIVLNALMNIFSRDTMRHSEYVFKVLFPEVLIMIFMQVHKIDNQEKAIEEMNNVSFDVDAPLGFG